MTPDEAEKVKNQKKVHQNIRSSRTKKSSRQNFKIGDLVRLSRHKNLFSKGYKQNWTEELFRVRQVMVTRPRTYLVEDLHGEPVQGSFYGAELQKTQIPFYARIEKVLKRKILSDGQTMIRVKWSGYPVKFNQWIPEESSSLLR